MNDDWRVNVTCPTGELAERLGKALGSGAVSHGLRDEAAERVIVSVDGTQLFIYAGTRAQAEQAAGAVASLAQADGAQVTTKLCRWHPVSEEWVDPDLPLPDSQAQVAAEHAEAVERDRAAAAQHHYAEYEVRVGTGSRRETLTLAAALADEGISCLRRWRYLLIGAADEDSAQDIAARVRALAGEGVTVEVQATPAAVAAALPPNPFAVFGGLGG
jgi:hypothetical protein